MPRTLDRRADQELVDVVRRQLQRMREEIMLTRTEVKEQLAQLLKEVRETRGAAQSAIVFARGFQAKVDELSKGAEDLEEFREGFDLIKAENKATEEELRKSIEAAAPPADK